MRRKWREAMPKGATTAASKAAIGYEYCSKLFALEKKFFKMSDAVRKTARQVKVEPLLEAYWLWLKTLALVPGSKLAEAGLGYVVCVGGSFEIRGGEDLCFVPLFPEQTTGHVLA